MRFSGLAKMLAAGCFVAAMIVTVPSCQRKEKLIDIETPHGKVEVERTKDSGEVDVEFNRNK